MPQETSPETPPTPATTDEIGALTDRELLVRVAKIADHLDVMVHDIHGWARTAAPLLDRIGSSAAARLFSGPKRNGHGHGSR